MSRLVLELAGASLLGLLGLGWFCALFLSFQLDGAPKQAQHWYDEARVQSTMIRGLRHMLTARPSDPLSEFTHEDRVPLVEPVEEG